MTRFIALKIGSNVLTRPDGSLDITRMSALVDQVAALHHRGIKTVIISSGAVASGRSILKGTVPEERLDPVSARQLFSAVGQARLINRYYELFRDHSIACGQVLTQKDNFATRRHYLNQKHCICAMLEAGVIPIVNENDTASVTELMFTDNDELSGLIASMLSVDLLVILSNIDGVYTGSPADPASRLIPTISPDDDITGCIQASKSTAGRGGMATKHRIARKVASEGIGVIIANGTRPDILTDLIDRPDTVPHTRFIPSGQPVGGVKKWLAHSTDFAKGSITVNDGARQALEHTDGTSLLAVGITGTSGQWEKDDLVAILTADGTQIAIGRAAYSSAQTASMAGTRGHRPIVHADYLWFL